MSERLNIDQKRAAFAYSKRTAGNDSNYDAMVKKVPAYIQNNGFVYTLAFLAEKKDGKSVFKVIYEWHTSAENACRLQKLQGISESQFLKTLAEMKTPNGVLLTDEEIRLLTMETLTLFTWLRRFVKDE